MTAMMAPANGARIVRAASRRSITILDREPFGEPFALDLPRIAIVQQVAKFVDQDVIEVKVLDALFGPHEIPGVGRLVHPTSTIHASFVRLVRLRGLIVTLDEIGLNGVKIDGGAPLHAVARKALLLASHAAELHDFQTTSEFGG